MQPRRAHVGDDRANKDVDTLPEPYGADAHQQLGIDRFGENVVQFAVGDLFHELQHIRFDHRLN
jgi:hypothetical protein